MKRVLAISFLFVFLIAYITPITSVYATEVNWGDNDSYYLTSEEFYTARQLATLDIISQLCSNGVNELSINNANTVDEWISNFIEYVDENAQNGTYEIYQVCNEIKNNIDDTANRIGIELKSVGTNLNNGFNDIIDWFNDLTTNQYIEYRPNSSFIRDLSRLSRLQNNSNNPLPTPDPNYSYYINTINYYSGNGLDFFFKDGVITSYSGYHDPPSIDSMSYVVQATDSNTSKNIVYSAWQTTDFLMSDIITAYINEESGYYYLTLNGVNYYNQYVIQDYWNDMSNFRASGSINGVVINRYGGGFNINNAQYTNFNSKQFNSLQDVFTYLLGFRNINIYVNGNPWSIVSNITPTNISLDINGIDLYGDNDPKPIQYYYPQGTQIDYKKLYDVIKRAIDDSTSINNQTIWEGDTYYDSHDNVYTPTIYNYYSNDDNESESDVLEDIINIAIIPKFDIALLQPIEEPLVNGEKIMLLGVQSLPEDILFVIGAGFVLILFGAMINRLIE